MRMLLAVDGSSSSQEAIDEVAARPWPEPSVVRIVSVVRSYVPPVTDFLADTQTR